MSSVVFFLALASVLATKALAFSSLPPTKSSASAASTRSVSMLFAGKSYPPMSRDEVQAILDTVPVFAVTDPDMEGLVMVKEPNNPNDISYFFFSAEAANTVYAPLRKKENEKSGKAGEWSVSAYPLGLVWFELINDPDQQNQGVEYRLLPEPDNLIGAQNMLMQQQKESGASNPKANELFKMPFNQIPIFVDQFLRLTVQATEGDNGDEKNERVPLYVGLDDLTEACKQAMKATSGSYQPAMSVIDLKDLIDEMTKENANDYRSAILIPPTPKVSDADATTADSGSGEAAEPSAATASSEDFNWAGKQSIYGKPLADDQPISTPTATNDWSD
eukprot:CAMPEP_0197180526 /NCGR_PEP_ID=MMETSP1423-20130617/5105_1 /TAXON_ID=476441 /ORGANISM="Pseudo-nitzschia heimii, Strain UNC1101" /LENGTH=332 /DNA_ID=CAMNT_0042630613 /DNA_START=14 /DNA_END=1012 /DNA_ORIENTATION=-